MNIKKLSAAMIQLQVARDQLVNAEREIRSACNNSVLDMALLSQQVGAKIPFTDLASLAEDLEELINKTETHIATSTNGTWEDISETTYAINRLYMPLQRPMALQAKEYIWPLISKFSYEDLRAGARDLLRSCGGDLGGDISAVLYSNLFAETLAEVNAKGDIVCSLDDELYDEIYDDLFAGLCESEDLNDLLALYICLIMIDHVQG